MPRSTAARTARLSTARIAALTLSALALAAAASLPRPARADTPPQPTMAELLKAAPVAEWRALDPEHTLYMDLPAGRVIIELAPAFAPKHAENIRKLVREGYFDGLVIMRSQENYVAQWGDPDEKNPKPFKTAQKKLAPEFTVPMANDKQFVRHPDKDGYAPQVGFSNGFAAGRDPKAGRTWLTHCYGTVGVARGNESDSGDGSSLYVVTGHAPRQLDRNITLVGRVIDGMPLLTTLPRGPAPMGFYDKPEMHVPIKAIRLAADVPEAERSKLQVLRTDGPTFRKIVEGQRNRAGPWYQVPAGHIDVCNVPLPQLVRTAP